MLGKLHRLLFPYKDFPIRLAAVENKISEYQSVLDYFKTVGSIRPNDIKDLAYFFHLKRGESKSQLSQDLWALWEMKGKTGGYFVEFGATDGITRSNTLLLEQKYGWTGILAEPLPAWHSDLKKRKAVVDTRCVWSASRQKLPFLCFDAAELSGLKQTAPRDIHAQDRQQATRIEVETVSLHDLLTEHHAPAVIDYLSADTEGSEYEILSHFDFESFRFNLITVEHNYSPTRQKLFELLTRNGYLRVFEEFSDFDDWYVHRSLRPAQA